MASRIVRMTTIVAVTLTLLPFSIVLADLDPATREAVGAASVKLAALVTARENGAAEEIAWPLGSATFVSPDGLLLTNAHVIDLSGLIARLEQDQVAFARQGRDRRLRATEGRYLVLITEGADLRRRYIADLVVTDSDLDLAVLRLSGGAHGEPLGEVTNLPFVALGDSDTLQLGDAIHVFGYPATAGGTQKYTRGYVSGFDVAPGILGWAWIDSDATVSGGSSGGTAVDDAGRLIAVPTLATPLDCRPGDTNGDGVVDESDIGCVPVGDSFLRLRPINLAKPLLHQVSPFFASPPPATPASGTSTAVPTTAATASATTASAPPATSPGAEWLAAVLAAAQSRPSVAGPFNGTIAFQTGTIFPARAGVRLHDFAAHVRFTNPAPGDQHSWDYGIAFGDEVPEIIDEFRLVLWSLGGWYLYHGELGFLHQGVLTGLDTSATGETTMDLVVMGNRAAFAVNGTYIATLDVSADQTGGNVFVGSGFFPNDVIPGALTGYSEFQVWSLDGLVLPAPPTTPTAGNTELYAADWSPGLNGWTTSPDWSVQGGLLVSDGTNPNYLLSAIPPYQPGDVADYAVEAEIQLVASFGCSSFGIVARSDAAGNGYRAGTEHGCLATNRRYISGRPVLVETTGGVDGEWHTYRFEVKGSHLALFVDGTLLVEADDTNLPAGGLAGLWSSFSQINVRRFTVSAL